MNAPIDPQHLPPLVSAEWLAAHRDDVVVADVRWYLDGRSTRAAYESGHIAGAVYVDMDNDLSDHSLPATMGRHPLASPERFAAAMGRLGVGDHTAVVAYDDSAGGTAGRLVVMLRSLGRSAALLDGGLSAWVGPHDTGPGAATVPTTFTPGAWPPERFVPIEEVEQIASGADTSTVFLDARAGDRFRGEVEPIDPRAGHIPGARNAPWGANVDPSTGTYRTPAELRSVYGELGVTDSTEVICCCGSGVTACADVLAIEHAGFPAPRLFVTGWSGWCNYPNRPGATGTA